MRRSWTRIAIVVGLLGGCSASSGGGTGTASPPPAGGPLHAPVAATAQPAASPDATFMRGMVAHHEQAVAMTDLVAGRAARDDIRLLAERIRVSQQDEIAFMTRWLRRHETAGAATAPHAHHGEAHHAGMPGMLSPQELAKLAAAKGAEFDQLFLELMIRHHEGALTMVAELLSRGGAQESELFRFASDVDADQRAEIARMRRMQTAGGAGRRP